MVLDLILTTTVFGVPTVLLSPGTGLLTLPGQPCSSRVLGFFHFLIVLRQGKLEITPIKFKVMQRDADSLSFLNQSHLQLCASSYFLCQIMQRNRGVRSAS